MLVLPTEHADVCSVLFVIINILCNCQRTKIFIDMDLLKVSRASTKLMVEVNGFEPMTSCVQGRRSPN